MLDNIPSYKNYLAMKERLTFEQMHQIHENILKNVDSNNQDFLDVWQNIIQSSINYTTTRAEWSYLSNEQKLNKDSYRTTEHNTVLTNFILLERIFILHSWNKHTWTKELFLQNDVSNRTRHDINEHRKRIGDFANYLAFIYAVNAR